MAELGKKLGKLSLAILENFVEGVLGKKFVDELRSPTDRALAMDAALVNSEQRFAAEFPDKAFAERMFNGVSEKNIGLFLDAIEHFYSHPAGSKFQATLNQVISESFPEVDQELIPSAAKLYNDILTEELALADPGFRENVRALADLRSVDILRRVEALLSTRETAKIENTVFRSLHQLPQPPADFTGREELVKQLIQDFHSHKGAAITGKPLHGLVGMGGVGKTALGLVVAHEIAKDFPDAQIFLDLKGTTEPLSAADIMRHVITSFEPTMDLRTLNENSLANAYRTVLNSKKALLFLDNARSADQIKPLIPPETCALLVTSRWSFPVGGLKNHALGVMKKEDAEEFLVELCPRTGEYVAGLARACGYLPLALRIAGSFLGVNENEPVDDYLKQLEDHQKRLTTLKESHKEAELKAEPELLAAFALSYNQLEEGQQKHWRVLGVFPTSFAMSAAQAMWETEESETRKLLSLLCRYSLLDYDETSARYSLHDLLAVYARSQMDGPEEFDACLKHSSHYIELLTAANELYSKGGENVLSGLGMFDLERENILAGQSWVIQSIDNMDVLAICNEFPNAGFMILPLRLHPITYIDWLEKGFKAARKLSNRKYEGYHLGNLGNAYSDLGKVHKAIEFYKQHLVIAREIGHRRGEGAALGNLGNAYNNLDDVHKAIEFYEQSLVILREIGDRPSEGTALGNLGNAYNNLGDVHKAIEFYEQHMVIAREIGDRRGEGNALGNLGNAYSDLGDVHKAIEFYEQSLVILREIGDRPGEGTELGNLGSAYANLGDVHKAIEFYEQSLVILREIGDRRGEGNALYNMGLALYGLEEKDRAIDLVKQALAICEAIQSPLVEKTRNTLKEWGALPAGPAT
jgi:tetratricopeptide (TPR) repeat protein